MLDKGSHRFIQFELWKDCNNHCKFCFNKNQQLYNKEDSLKFVIDKLNSKDIDFYNEIGFIGGEFFGGQLDTNRVKSLFYSLFDICAEKRKNNKLDKLYITSSLIFDPDIDFFPFLEYLKSKNLLDITLLCTSYDIKYRFNKDTEKQWKETMNKCHYLYPELKLHVETIVTQFFIDAVLSDKFNILDFKKQYHTEIDFIEPASGFYYKDKVEASKDLPDFFPTRNSFLQLLDKNIETKEIPLYKFLSMKTRADTLYYVVDGERINIQGRRSSGKQCLPSTSTAKYESGYIDSDIRMIDDVVMYLNTLGE